MIQAFSLKLLVLAIAPAVALLAPLARAGPTEPALPLMPPEDEGQQDLLRFTVANQLQTSAIYSKLSFKADVIDRLWVRELDKVVPVLSKFSVSKRGNTSLINKTLLTTFKGGALSELQGPFEVSNDPNVTRMLQTPNYLMLWSNVAVPHVAIWFVEDWKLQKTAIEHESDNTYGQVKIERLCFGGNTPLHELISRTEFAPRWTATPSGESGNIKVQRQVQSKPQQYVTDLEYSLDSRMGTVQKRTFMSAGGPPATTLTIEYAKVELNGALLLVPSSYLLEHHSPDRKQQNNITFSGYADETAMPPFTVKQLGIPVGARITRKLPNDREERKAWDGNIQTIEQWRTKK